jgi:D-lactate dehydrogenase
VVVPVSRIPQLVDGVHALSREFDLPIVCFGHAGNGNLHVNLLFDPQEPGIEARTQSALDELFAATLALGGQLSGEHGIGLAKRAYMERALDANTLAAMRAIKQVFDPDGILNPGKLLP